MSGADSVFALEMPYTLQVFSSTLGLLFIRPQVQPLSQLGQPKMSPGLAQGLLGATVTLSDTPGFEDRREQK